MSLTLSKTNHVYPLSQSPIVNVPSYLKYLVFLSKLSEGLTALKSQSKLILAFGYEFEVGILLGNLL